MKSKSGKANLACAAMMGILTMLLCLVVADGVIGLSQPPAGNYRGIVLFWGIQSLVFLACNITYCVLRKKKDR